MFQKIVPVIDRLVAKRVCLRLCLDASGGKKTTVDGRVYKRTHDVVNLYVQEELEKRGILDRRHMGGCFVVHNASACGRQPFHIDVPPTHFRDDANPPLHFLLSVQEGTRLHLLLEGGEERTVHIPEGSALVFDARIPHSGAEYPTPHTRLFGFLPSKGIQTPAVLRS